MGVINPIRRPARQPRIRPPNRTGMCIGKKIEPLIPKLWKNIGRIMPQVINKAENDSIKFYV